MNRMLDLLYADELLGATLILPAHYWNKYVSGETYMFNMFQDHLTTMLLLIAVAEGFEL